MTCLLQLERSKTEVFNWSCKLPESSSVGLKAAGCEVEGQFLPGFMCYGIPIDNQAYVKHQLSLKVQEVAREVEEIVKVLDRRPGHLDSCKIQHSYEDGLPSGNVLSF